MLSMSSSGMSQVRSLAITTAGAVLTYCQHSIALVGKKKDSEKK
jgi:hypothetical protein